MKRVPLRRGKRLTSVEYEAWAYVRKLNNAYEMAPEEARAAVITLSMFVGKLIARIDTERRKKAARGGVEPPSPD